jgi:hypothetical protein
MVRTMMASSYFLATPLVRVCRVIVLYERCGRWDIFAGAALTSGPGPLNLGHLRPENRDNQRVDCGRFRFKMRKVCQERPRLDPSGY